MTDEPKKCVCTDSSLCGHHSLLVGSNRTPTLIAPDDEAMMRGMLQVLMQTIVICRKAWPKETRRMLEKVVKS